MMEPQPNYPPQKEIWSHLLGQTACHLPVQSRLQLATEADFLKVNDCPGWHLFKLVWNLEHARKKVDLSFAINP